MTVSRDQNGDQPRVAVVGAGIVGLCTGYQLLRRGVDVTVYEQGVPGNSQSGGVSRVLRFAHDDPRLVRATRHARRLYGQWGAELGVRMVSDDGVLALGPTVPARLEALQAACVGARALASPEVAEVLPPLAGYEGPAMLDTEGGSIDTVATISALARALGERLWPEEVLSLRPIEGSDAVEVRSGGTTEVFDRVVVAAGRGTPHLARGIGLSLPVRQGVHVRLTFEVRGEALTRMPALLDSSDAFGETGIYAAAVPGNTAYGLGLSQSTPVSEDGALAAPDELADLAERARTYVSRALPGLDPDPSDVRHCWVTELPWGPDGMAVWHAGGVLVVAGHNLFKHAPNLGGQLAHAACTGELDPDLLPESRLGAPVG